MAKARGNIGTLPYLLREQINERLRDNTMTYKVIAEWLLSCPIEPEGLPVSTIYADSKDAVKSCINNLWHWMNSKHFARWEKEAAQRDDILRRVRNITAQFNALEEPEKDRFAMSVVLQGFEQIIRGDADAKDIFMLTTAYCNLRGLKKGDVRAEEILSKLQEVASDTKATRDSGKPIDVKAVLDAIDQHLAGGRKRDA